MQAGINIEKIQKIRKKINDHIEELNIIFSNINEQMNIIKDNLFFENKDKLNSLYDNIEQQYPIIKENIMSYMQDLENIILSYENHAEILSQQINNNIQKINERRQ